METCRQAGKNRLKCNLCLFPECGSYSGSQPQHFYLPGGSGLRLPFLPIILIKCQKLCSVFCLPLRGNNNPRCGSHVSEFPIFTRSLLSNSSLSRWLLDPFMKIFLYVSSDFKSCLQNSLVCHKW